MSEGSKSLKSEAQFVALLSFAEVGLGSIVHAFNIPLGGHLLSLNQALLLSRSVIEKEPRKTRAAAARSVNRISTAGALMKSLSPAGKVLTPMLALTVQGFLFSLGILVAGTGLTGLAIGAVMLALWGIFQPLILGFLIYGKSVFEAIVWAWDKMAASLGIDPRFGWRIFVGLIVVKAILAVIAVQLSRMERGRTLSASLGRRGRAIVLKKLAADPSAKKKHPFWGALKDLGSPIFIFSFTLTTAFLYFSRPLSQTELFWISLRPLAVAFVIFYLMRAVSPPVLRRALYRISPSLAELLTESSGR